MFRGNCVGKRYYVWLPIHLPTDETLMKGAVLLQSCLSDAVYISVIHLNNALSA